MKLNVNWAIESRLVENRFNMKHCVDLIVASLQTYTAV